MNCAGQKRRRYHFLHHESVGADLAEQRLAALRFSRQESQLAHAVVFGHMRPHLLHASFEAKQVSRRACHRFFRDVGGKRAPSLAGLDTLMLALADYQATYSDSPPPHWQAYLEHTVQLLEFAFETHPPSGQGPAPLLDGYSLMQKLDLQPGPYGWSASGLSNGGAGSRRSGIG